MSVLIHGTAVAIGTTGLLLLGPSGSGKSSMALGLITAARQLGHFAALVSDDQVYLQTKNGQVIAHAPKTIAGLIELRGSGVASIDHIEAAVLEFAVELIDVTGENRVPETNRTFSPDTTISLPLLSLDRLATDPFARFSALRPGFPVRAFEDAEILKLNLI
jgi:serine kinase of HPr protein (carbohydrate metabolism regulator)